MQRIFLLRSLACSLTLAVAACQHAPAPAAKAPAAAAPEAPAVAVHGSAATLQALPAVLSLSGSLAPDETSEVAAPAPGIVTEVLVDVGSQVQKDDVLVRIDRRDASMRLTQATAATAQALARLGIKPGDAFNAQKVPEVRVAREALDLAETEAKRAKALFDGGSAALSVWDQARVRLEQARGQYDSAQNAARQAWSALQGAKATQDLSEKAQNDTEVRAPFAGVITEKRIAPGEFAPMGRVVAVLVRTDPLRLKFDVPEVDVGKVRLGAEVTLTVAAFPGRTFKGLVKRLGGALKSTARSLPVEAEVPNTDDLLRPGFFCRIDVAIEDKPSEAILVPASAVGSSGSASRVFVIQGDRAIEHIVSVGRSFEHLVEVRGSVQAGEIVASDHVDQLSDGARVAVRP